ncbi:N-methyl-L-tryptophan oxidase [Planomicrobium sp. CPCC 101110]|uniref:N-methyl-L-tryptophan oxidase n=1 Tax=Planomicrobium sp. CPCC 101110 TaxID=2599619 RepID=UPI0011B53DF3|nr:N-methyl-L-tryptophan oxidase [Planomicrobium sp. CPCC 101110]TWT25777.1 N-methyl-L-tryptophan oxidase [Planomicrobium sp. CPCC 101110]
MEDITYDVAIIGGGTMGIATAYYLAKAQQKVLVIDQFSIPNNFGSHHGETRILRLGYGNGGIYVPLVKEALVLWKDLEQETGKILFNQTGAISVGHPGSDFVKETIESSLQYNLTHEKLDAKSLMARWPGILVPDDYIACYDPHSGFLYSEECVQTYKEESIKLGVTILENQRVEDIQTSEAEVKIVTADATLVARKAVITAGAWIPKLLPELDLDIEPLRKTFGWFETSEEDLYGNEFPCFVFDTHNVGHYYGFPDYDGKGLKVGRMDLGDVVDPDEVNRDFFTTSHEEDDLRSFLSRFLPQANGQLNEGKVCLFSMTPDNDFIIDFHPEHSNLVIAGGFSGHGFKFASVIGKILTDLAIEGKTDLNISFLKLNRFYKEASTNEHL